MYGGYIAYVRQFIIGLNLLLVSKIHLSYNLCFFFRISRGVIMTSLLIIVLKKYLQQSTSSVVTFYDPTIQRGTGYVTV